MVFTGLQESKRKFYINNFDLIRLFAALQVVHVHLIVIFGVQVADAHKLLFKFLGFFPGVPIFFFISGFLISRSWVNSKGTYEFSKKRALRIFPALIFSVVLALFLVIVSGYYSAANMNFSDLLLIFLTKSTFLQFYNTDSLRGYGDGVLNGSLWTITVELQFYILTPVVFIFLSYFRKKLNFNRSLIVLFVSFFIMSIFLKYNIFTGADQLIQKILKVTFIPWFYMFLLGVLFQTNFDFFYRFLGGKFFEILLIYIVITAALVFVFKADASDFGNLMNPFLFPLLAVLIFSAAYTNVNLSDKILHGNDISYGAYIYHMPIINWALYNNYASTYGVSLALLFFIVIFSVLSWMLLERPFLKLK